MEYRVERLEKRFGPQRVLNEINLNIRPGECLVVTGPNGVGKSTLVQCLGHSLSWNSGQAYFDNQIFDLKNDVQHTSMMLGDDTAYMPLLTVYENLLFYSALSGLKKSLAHSALAAIAQFIPIEEIYNLKPSQCSRGNLQLFYIVRCLMNTNATFYLMDEPLTHLDPLKIAKVIAYFKNLMATGKGLLVTAQEVQLSFYSDIRHQVLRLNKGAP